MKSLDKAPRILVVDDDPCMVRLVGTVIERAFGSDLEVQCLTDPTQAREVIEAGLFDILITDLEMPGLNGLGLLRCAKRRNALTQVLFLTGHSSLEALNEAMELGATDYLLKPLDHAELIALLTQAQQRVRRWRHALVGTLFPFNKPVSAAVN